MKLRNISSIFTIFFHLLLYIYLYFLYSSSYFLIFLISILNSFVNIFLYDSLFSNIFIKKNHNYSKIYISFDNDDSYSRFNFYNRYCRNLLWPYFIGFINNSYSFFI